MKFTETPLAGVWLVEADVHFDERGAFMRTFDAEEFASRGLGVAVTTSAVSSNLRAGTLRGLHFQAPPYEEAKIVRCCRGAIYDVVVDLRPTSPTRGRWFATGLSQASGRMLFIPPGFAHGYQTLVDDCEVAYNISGEYRPSAARGFRYDDPKLLIEWPLPVSCISKADESWGAYGP